MNTLGEKVCGYHPLHTTNGNVTFEATDNGEAAFMSDGFSHSFDKHGGGGQAQVYAGHTNGVTGLTHVEVTVPVAKAKLAKGVLHKAGHYRAP